jgi:hypothetical protein
MGLIRFIYLFMKRNSIGSSLILYGTDLKQMLASTSVKPSILSFLHPECIRVMTNEYTEKYQ